MINRFMAAFALSLAVAPPVAATEKPVQQVIPSLPYAVVADLVLASPVIADATIRSASRIKGADAADVSPGKIRFYVEADIGALVRGTDGIPPRIGYLVDMPVDTKGKAPKLKKMRVLLFARPVAGSPGQLQLVGSVAQQPWAEPLDTTTRAVTREILSPDAPPTITGIGNAFYVAGALPGEGETQIFLTTADNRPVSLSILRRPGEQRRWAVALSEIVDETAQPPKPQTLLWYRLACSLPAALPDRSTAQLAQEDADAARDDYRFVLDSLGPCGRTAP